MDEISCNSFYGENSKHLNFEGGKRPILSLSHSSEMKKLLGPPRIWKTFKKQNECLKYVTKNNDLIPFTFQDPDDCRIFLAAHPSLFWHYDSQRHLKDRHSYEIIQEYVPCKLYFDLEFEIMHNTHRNGNGMLNSLIKLVNHALKTEYNIKCDSSCILDLDSTSSTKFSRHLIFQGSTIFSNNYNAGGFVKRLCYEIRYLLSSAYDINSSSLRLLKYVDISFDELSQLQVMDAKGNKKLFVDEAVYSKNRHFRLIGSSKLNKNVPLKISAQNTFIPIVESGEFDKHVFLQSLITYNSYCGNEKFLEFRDTKIEKIIQPRIMKTCNFQSTSPFPDIDKLIESIVSPGQIWRMAFFPDTNVITYDIVNNRYCKNIGREHKSNNVKYVVNISDLTYYQKCYDPDCAGFKSDKIKLPMDIKFLLNDENIFNFSNETVFNALELLEQCENNDEPLNCSLNSNKLKIENFHDYGITDSQLMNI